MSKKDSNQISREVELLLQDFSRSVTVKSQALFYGNALIVSAVPIWLFWRIHSMPLTESSILFTLVTLTSTYFVATAYKNMKFYLKHKIAQKHEDAIIRHIHASFVEGSKMTKKEKDERILWKKNEIADYEATTFSIFYSNTVFLLLIIIASFYVFSSFKPPLNYTLSVGGAGVLLALFSTGSE